MHVSRKLCSQIIRRVVQRTAIHVITLDLLMLWRHLVVLFVKMVRDLMLIYTHNTTHQDGFKGKSNSNFDFKETKNCNMWVIFCLERESWVLKFNSICKRVYLRDPSKQALYWCTMYNLQIELNLTEVQAEYKPVRCIKTSGFSPGAV